MKSKTLLICGGILSATLATTAVADQPSYNFVDVGYLKLRLGGEDLEPTGYFVQGSMDVHENAYVFGGYADVDDSVGSLDVEAEQYSIGVGYKTAVSNNASVYASLAYVDAEAEAEDGSDSSKEDTDGYSVGFGIRSQETERLELNAGISYTKTDEEDGFSMSLGSAFYMTDNLGIVAGIGTDTDNNREYSVGFRLRF